MIITSPIYRGRTDEEANRVKHGHINLLAPTATALPQTQATQNSNQTHNQPIANSSSSTNNESSLKKKL